MEPGSPEGQALSGTPPGALKPKYEILGADIAGRVEAVGKNAKQLKPGDEVFGDISGCLWGGFAEYMCAREDVLALKPAGMSFEETAAVPQAAVLALQGFRDRGRIQQGKRVFINGAGGSVSTFATKIAKSFGAEITGVDSTEKLDLIRSVGADRVIDYTKGDFTKSGEVYDPILDIETSRSIFAYRRSLAPEGIYVMVGYSTRLLFQMLFLAPWLSIIGSGKMCFLLHRTINGDLDYMKELFEAGEVRPVID
jgi:NADPH:quinone reductase-like Zn-dependent oxidoreductase